MSEADWIPTDEEIEEKYELYSYMIFANKRRYFNELWKNLKSQGFIWQDIKGQKLRANQISNRYLRNILRFIKNTCISEEQVSALKSLAKERGVKC